MKDEEVESETESEGEGESENEKEIEEEEEDESVSCNFIAPRLDEREGSTKQCDYKMTAAFFQKHIKKLMKLANTCSGI